MTFRLCIVAVTLAAIGFGASRLNRRLRVDRPSPLTLRETIEAEMVATSMADHEWPAQ